jgi:hypothetical protein
MRRRNPTLRTKRPPHREPAKKRRSASLPIPGRLARRQEARIRGLAAINRHRRGESKSLSAAARSEGTSVKSIKRLLPGALLPSRPGERLRVRASDSYRQSVEILTDGGATVVTARGSRERELAGQHRAAYLRVLRGDESASILKRFRGKTVGNRKLLTNSERLFELAHGGVVDNLAPLYVSPDPRLNEFKPLGNASESC